LKAPGQNQMANVGRKAAPGRGYGEERNTGGENLAAAVQVAQSSAREKQRCEKREDTKPPLGAAEDHRRNRAIVSSPLH
jgi:hypothetical protein